METIQRLYHDCLDEKISPEHAITEIDKYIGGITAIFYTPQRFTIQNHTVRYSLNTQNQSKKKVKRRTQLALLAHKIAKLNGSRLPGELHISKQASTKHHSKGIERMLGG